MNPAHVANSDAPRIGDKYKCAEDDATYLLGGLRKSTFEAVCDGSIFLKQLF